MVTEGTFGNFKGIFRILHREGESNKETIGLACVILHNIYIDKRDLVPRKFDLTYDIPSNKHSEPHELRDLLDLTDEW